MQARADGAALDGQVDHERARGVRSGDPGVVDLDAVRPAAAHAEHAVPVVEALVLVGGDDEHEAGVLRVLGMQERLAHEVRRVRDAGGVGELAADHVAVVARLRDADRGAVGRAHEVPVGSEEVGLGRLVVHRGDLQDVGPAEAQAPPGRRAAARDLDDHAEVGLEIELVAAEAPRLEDAVEARLREGLVRVLRVERALLGLLLALEQLGPHRRRAGHDLAWREVGLGDLDGARRGGRLLHADLPSGSGPLDGAVRIAHVLCAGRTRPEATFGFRMRQGVCRR